MTDFTRAAMSYLGLPEDTVLIPSDPGHIAFQIPLGMALVAGIADRMNVLAEAEQEAPLAVCEMPSNDEIAQDYYRLSPKEKAKYGSVGLYVRQRVFDLLQADHASPSIPNFDKTLPDRRGQAGVVLT